jgi:translocation and assembly module TamB
MEEPVTPSPPTPGPAPAVHRQAAAAPLRTALSLLLPLGMVIACLLLLAGGVTGLVRWWLLEEAGSQWLVQRLPMVKIEGFRGTLAGPQWQADRVRVEWGSGKSWLVIEGLSATGVRWTYRPHQQAWASLGIESLGARKVTVHTGPRGPRPIPAPPSLALPLDIQVRAGQLAELVVDTFEPMRELAFTGLVLDNRTGATHHVDDASATWQGLHLQLSAHIATAAPQPLSARATVRPVGADADAPAWAAVVQAGGTLPRPQLAATLRGVPRAGQEPPAVDLRTVLNPLQAWPLEALSLHTQELDLAALSSRAPQTRVSGSATLAPRVAGAPLTAAIELRNTLPGRWNERRLPLTQLTGEVRGSLDQPDRLAAPKFELVLADAGQGAGRLSGSAAWTGAQLQLDAKLDNVAPQRLDGRAAAMVLSGPVTATLRGLPSPSGKAAPAGSGPALDWKIDLEGTLDRSPLPVRLLMEGSANDQRLEVMRLRADSGPATAELRGLLQRAGKSDWKLETSGSLTDFDPLPWWPGETGGAWRQGPHRVSAGWQLDLRVPGQVAALPTMQLLQRLSGNGNLRVHDSLLAGVPLAADLKLGYASAAAPTSGQLRVDATLGGNRISIDGRGEPAGNGQADRWQAEIDAENLSTLAPLARLHPGLATWVPTQGNAAVSLAAEGRWPAMRTEGTARVRQLKAGAAALVDGQASWKLDSSGERAVAMKLALAGLQWGEQRADHLRADINGTLAEHRIEVSSALPLRPPDAAAQVMGVQAQSGTRAQMLAQGSWRADAAGGGSWRARIERLLAGSWDGSAGDAPPASLWLQARDLRAELQFDGSGRLLTLQADPGRAQLADNIALRWDEVQGDWREARPRLRLRADIEPFALSPLLARLQPRMGWGGDIRLAARVDIRAAERFEADLSFERDSGDLHITNGEAMQLLGLTDLRLKLSARDGVWQFDPVFKGRSLGEITGSVRVQTTPERAWPHADATVQGEVQARVADIGIWGAWVPPGWRLAGELRTSASLSGRFGQPRYTGEVSGNKLSVRNLLQGVNLSEGEVLARLEGDKATIERFTLRGGDGTLTLSGGATLGAVPQATLQLKAERFRVIGRVDRAATASGQAQLVLSREKGQLEGRFVLDEGLYDTSRKDAPSLDDDVTVRRPGEREVAVPDARPTTTRNNFALALDLDLGQKLRVRGRGLDTGLRGSVRIVNPGGRLDVRGTINAQEGTYAAYGQKLSIERGIVAFAGPPDDPRLNILALRPNTDTRVGVAITGTLLTPRVRLFSDPEMSDTDKLSWLVLGRATDGLGRTDTALLQRAAVALLSGEGEAPTDALMRNLGIDELSLKQSDGDVRETVISLGKQLSRRWYLGYERGVNSTAGTWQLIYRIAQRFTLRAQSGLENSLDLIWTWRLQETPDDAAMRKSSVKPP